MTRLVRQPQGWPDKPEYLGDHAALVVEMALAVRDSVDLIGPHGDQDYLRRIAEHARHVHQQTQELLVRAREDLRDPRANRLLGLLLLATEAADVLEACLFSLVMLPESTDTTEVCQVRSLANRVVRAALKYARSMGVSTAGAETSIAGTIRNGEAEPKGRLLRELAGQLRRAEAHLREAATCLEE